MDNRKIAGMDTTELQTAIVAVFTAQDPENVAGVDYKVLSTEDAQAYINTWKDCTVTDIANELVLTDYVDPFDDISEEEWDYEHDGQPDEAQEWYDFNGGFEC
jgi:hypothetical protein